MKQSLLLLSFITSSAVSFAQTNTYLQNNPQWVVLNSNGVNYPCIIYDSINYYLNGDSLINSLQYKQLFKCGSAWSSWQSPQPNTNCNLNYAYCDTVPVGFLRSQGLQMYFIPNGDTSEQLLYNFNLTIGSQLPQTYTYCCPAAEIVTSIDSIYTPYGYRKRFFINNGSEYLVEGIGSWYGLIEPWGPQLDQANQLLCYGLNDTAWFPNQGPYCSVITGISTSTPEKTSMELYPNPASQNVNVEITGNQLQALEIYDVLGQLVKQQAETNIAVEELPAGVYIVRGYFSDMIITRQLIIE